MIEPLPDDMASLFSSERALPPADSARQAAVRARVWKTLGLGSAPPPPRGGGFVTGAVVAVIAVASGAIWFAHRQNATTSNAPSAVATNQSAGEGTARLRATPFAAFDPQPTAKVATTPPATDWMGQLDVPPRSIDGVVTLLGRPVAGADVTLASPSTGPGGAPLQRAISDDNGRFHFPEQPAWTYAVVAEHTGLTAATASIDLRIPGAGQDVTLALAQCTTRVRGGLRDVAGGVIVGARVMSLVNPWHGASTTSNANGEYSLCVPASRARLYFSADGYGATGRVVDVPQGGSIVDVALAPENIVEGLVLGPDGAPRAGAQVNLWHQPGDSNGADAHGVTDANGHFEIGGIAAGQYAVNAWTRDAVTWSPYQINVVDGLVEPLTLRLEQSAQIRGFVIRNQRRAAAADVVATRFGSGDTRSIHARSQEDGSFTLHAVPEGDVALLVDGRRVMRLSVGSDGVRGLYLDADQPLAH